MKKAMVVLVIAVGVLVGTVMSVSAQDEEVGPFIPAIASFILPGFGQLLNGEINKAIVHFGIEAAIWTTAVLLSELRIPIPVTGAALLGLRVFSAYDAYTVAERRGFSLGLTEDGLTLACRF